MALRGFWSWITMVVLCGCGTNSSGDNDSGTASTTDPTGAPTTDTHNDDDAPQDDGDTQPDEGAEDPDSSDDDADTGADTTGDSTADDTMGEDTMGQGVDRNGCPVGAPDAWIACEDFDAITDAPTQLSQWNVNADGFAVVDGEGTDGGRGLRVRLQPGIMFGGWVTIRFGQGPDAPSIDSPEGQWDEVWARYRVRTQLGWPGRAIGDLGEVIAMNGSNWAIAADLNLHAEASMEARARGWTCIFGGNLACDGSNDWAGTLQNTWGASGQTVIFDAAQADTWQCVEAHMRLNTPGAADGEAHVWINGAMEIEQTGLDWRGTWDDFGINAVRFTNFADPVDSPLDFVFDDLVVSTEPIGCD